MKDTLFVVFTFTDGDKTLWRNHKLFWPDAICDITVVRKIEEHLAAHFDINEVTLVMWSRFEGI
jgi:hypothetical protein